MFLNIINSSASVWTSCWFDLHLSVNECRKPPVQKGMRTWCACWIIGRGGAHKAAFSVSLSSFHGESSISFENNLLLQCKMRQRIFWWPYQAIWFIFWLMEDIVCRKVLHRKIAKILQNKYWSISTVTQSNFDEADYSWWYLKAHRMPLQKAIWKICANTDWSYIYNRFREKLWQACEQYVSTESVSLLFETLYFRMNLLMAAFDSDNRIQFLTGYTFA